MGELNIPSGADYVDLPDEEFDKLNNFMPIDVCHYTSREKGLEKILETGKIRFSRLVDTNDPLESKQRIFADREWKNETSVWSRSAGEIEDELMREWRVLCFSCNKRPCKYTFMNEDYRRLFFSEHNVFGLGYSGMWAHYGENHKGVCFLFDGRELHRNIENSLPNSTDYIVKHGFVRYDDNKTFKPIARRDQEFEEYDENEQIRKTLIKNYKNNFLYKSTEWKPEHEFRWLIHAKDAGELFVPIKNAIKAVIVGANFSKIYINCVKELCTSLGASVGKITWFGGRPQVEFL